MFSEEAPRWSGARLMWGSTRRGEHRWFSIQDSHKHSFAWTSQRPFLSKTGIGKSKNERNERKRSILEGHCSSLRIIGVIMCNWFSDKNKKSFLFEVTNVIDSEDLLLTTLNMKNPKVILPKVFGRESSLKVKMNHSQGNSLLWVFLLINLLHSISH